MYKKASKFLQRYSGGSGKQKKYKLTKDDWKRMRIVIPSPQNVKAQPEKPEPLKDIRSPNELYSLKDKCLLHRISYCSLCNKEPKSSNCDQENDEKVADIFVERAIGRSTAFPPNIPKTIAQIERAIALLEHRIKKSLNSQSLRELEKLIGVYPTIEQAVPWKEMLRTIRRE